MPNVAGPLSFGPLLRQKRIAAGLTQEALAERTGLGVRSIQHLEGGAHRPHRATIERLTRVLELTVAERSVFERAAQPTLRQRVVVSVLPGNEPDPSTGPGSVRHNLPAPLTSFVGRERELAEVKQWLASSRLLTVTGVGGTGKTRLALEVSADVVGSYPDGVWFVDLAPLSDPALVPSTVASAVGVSEQHGEPLLITLLRVLHDQNLLLLLDNCEHLVEACAQLAATILQGCARIRILATSREALGITGERVWSLLPLPVPPADWRPTDPGDGLAALAAFAAVPLFVERARAAAPAFQLTPSSAEAVVEICRRVDGIPLAIELAAARVKVFSVQRIAGRLDDLFRLLAGGSRTALPRHQTMRALIDWSYTLLGEPERLLFRRLSIFVGGCSYEAIEAVCGDSAAGTSEGTDEAIARDMVPDVLRRLVDHSLVIVEHGDDERYRLLEPIRQYGWDRLAETGKGERVRDRHLNWFLQFAEEVKPELIGPRQVFWLDRLEQEHDNLRAALAWALERGPAEPGMRLAGALWRFWFARDYLAEGPNWLRRVLATPGASEPTLARAEVLNGAHELGSHQNVVAARRGAEEWLAINQMLQDRRGVPLAMCLVSDFANNEGDEDRAEELLGEALVLARQAGAHWVAGQALGRLARVAQQRGDNELAQRRSAEDVAIFRGLEDRRAMAGGLVALGWATCRLGDYAVARAHVQEALTIARELRSERRISESLGALGVLAWLEDDDGPSRALLEESLALAKRVGDQTTTGRLLFQQGLLARAEGDVKRADSLAREALVIERDRGAIVGAARVIILLGVLAIERAGPRPGVRLLSAAGSPAARNWWLLPADRQAYAESLAVARGALGEVDFASAWAEGQAMTLEQAIADALKEESA